MRGSRSEWKRSAARRGERLGPAIAGAAAILAIPPLTLAVLDSTHAHASSAGHVHDADCRTRGLIGYYSALISAGPAVRR